jgi:hypothetical protein
MPENNLIKSITMHACPHCGDNIYIESEMTPPIVNSLFTEDDVSTAKSMCLERVNRLDINDEKKADVAKWVNNPETIFSATEIESIIASLQEPTV